MASESHTAQLEDDHTAAAATAAAPKDDDNNSSSSSTSQATPAQAQPQAEVNVQPQVQTPPSSPPSKFASIIKVYDPKGDLKLHRLSAVTTFTCGRCRKEKTAKLVATHRGLWDDLRCNACYGKLLSEGV